MEVAPASDAKNKGGEAKKDKDQKADQKQAQLKEKEAKKLFAEAVKRQNAYEKLEICIDLPLVFGETVPKKRKEVNMVKNVTPLSVWMQPNYLFNAMKALRPEEIFHKIDVYSLKWQPPKSKYMVLIPLDDPQLQENMLIQMHNMSSRERNRVIFFFAPKNPSVPMFAPKVHPSSLLSFRTNDQVLRKLCDYYLENKISLHDLHATLSGKYDLWRQTLFNILQPDEQEFHRYLVQSTEVIVTTKQAEKQYLDDAISLQEFADLKNPERKVRRELAALSYPRPYDRARCVICQMDDKGIIKCQNCNNSVCADCVQRTFLNPETKEGSFLLMHRRYCLRLGKLAPINAIIANEPAYLRELRATGRTAALEKLAEIMESQRMHREEEEVGEFLDEEAAAELERRRRMEQEEEERLAARRALECPPELIALQEQFKRLAKKFAKLEREVLINQAKLEGDHMEQFLVRVNRLKNEDLDKLRQQVKAKLLKVVADVNRLNLEGLPSQELTLEASDLLEKVEILLGIESVEDYNAAVKMLNLQIAARSEINRSRANSSTSFRSDEIR